MSLINQVLRDLDAREANEAGRREFGDRVRPLPAETRKAWHPVALAVGSALLGAGIAGFVLPKAAPEPSDVAAGAGSASVAQAVQRVAPLAEPPPVELRAETAVRNDKVAVETAAPAARISAKAAPVPVPAESGKKPAVEPALRKVPTALPVAATGKVAVPVPVVAPVAAPVSQRNATPAAADSGQVEKRDRGVPVSEAVESEYRKAMAAFKRGAGNEAQAGLRNVLLLDPRHASGRQALMSLLVEMQQWEEAMAVAETGLKVDPAQTGWAMVLARLQLDHRSAAEAVDTLARHARHAERNPEYMGLQAALLQRQGRSHEAAERYQAALALRPGEARWWFGLGNSLDADRRPQEARDAYLKAREIGNLPQELAGALEQRLR